MDRKEHGQEKMNASQAAIDLIKKFEGCSLKPYLCPAGIPTIGIGHTGGVTMKTPPITKDQAEELLKRDLREAEAAVNDGVKVPIVQPQFDALVCFTFNVGCGAFLRSTLLKKVNASDFSAALPEFMKWVYAGGKVSNGLKRRREAEAELFKHHLVLVKS